ncbi:uncharacterized protein H6S33_012649 [Morchella sextelata]|uniref:uncharacterized protein n=1 Tax=Morchella sextelata TaxID=1174677 RepID=UPI001D051ABC|nr:uncharacterized protein H6S33_012649 [Morchella sextelata]KAH0610103.1 hypothetical protein H6S33_012649 [Morchella sextelata]
MTDVDAGLTDIKLASISAGITIGVGFFTGWEAYKTTMQIRKPLKSIFVWMVWGEMIACTAITIQGWLLLTNQTPLNIPYAVILLTFWVFQVQLLMQIIINRCAVVMFDKRRANHIKWGTAIVVTMINISVFIIWIPAHAQNNARYLAINAIWDRIEKVILLVIDAALNWYFVRVVRQRLVSQGHTKYDKLVAFNIRIITVSLAMDCVIIGCMSLRNGAVYIQLHPLAYMVKLKIELSMAKLITRIARDGKLGREGEFELSSSKNLDNSAARANALAIHTQKDIIIDSQPIDDDQSSNRSATHGLPDSDERPLKDAAWRMGASTTVTALSQK